MREFLESRGGQILLMFIGMIVFSLAIVICAFYLPANERIYMYLVGIASNFSGSFFTLLHVASKSGPTQG